MKQEDALRVLIRNYRWRAEKLFDYAEKLEKRADRLEQQGAEHTGTRHRSRLGRRVEQITAVPEWMIKDDWEALARRIEKECRRRCAELLEATDRFRAAIGCGPRGPGRPRAAVDTAEVKRLHAEGVGISTLARRFNVSRQTIYRVLEVAGTE